MLDYKKEQRAKEIAALETLEAEKESQVESQERRKQAEKSRKRPRRSFDRGGGKTKLLA